MSVEGLIQQLVVHFRNGYWFYVQGRVPDGKDEFAVDEKLMSKYGVKLSKYQRTRRRARGFYNVQYLRFNQDWILLATHGTHPQDTLEKAHPESFHYSECKNLKDVRRSPLKCHGYSIGYRRGRDGKFHVQVRIEDSEYKEIRDYLVEMAGRRKFGWCVNQVWNIPYEPYKPVRKQMKTIVRQMNRVRKLRRQEQIPEKFIPWKRKIVKPFEWCHERVGVIPK